MARTISVRLGQAARALGAAIIGAGTCTISTGLVATTGPAFAGTPVPGATNCPMFPADNVWNTDVSSLPVNPMSAQWMASMSASTTNLHPDFGPSGDPSNPYGIPYNVVPAGHSYVGVSFTYADESDPGPYPFGPDTLIEGGQQSTGDRHAIMVDPATCTLYELYDAQYSATGPTAGSGAIWSLTSNALRPSGWTSADAAGLPIMAGLLRYDEVASGSVTHAIRMTAVSTDTSYLWPARHEAGSASNPNLPPMGARFRLKASFDISGYSAEAQVVLRAMQHYGLILADNGSNWYFGGTADDRWPIALVDELKTVPAGAFEAVDESGLMLAPDSGQALQPGVSVSGVSPASSPTGGGGTVTISGNGFTGATAVRFGTVQAPSFTVVSPVTISAVVPAASAAGRVDVTVSAPDGTSAAGAGDGFVYVASDGYVPLAPFRICDTRLAARANQCNAGGTAAGTLEANTTLTATVAGLGGVPPGAEAVVANVTVTDTTWPGGWLTLWPAGTSRPLASDLNFAPGETVANLVEVELGRGGAVDAYNAFGTADMIIDVEGYVAPTAPGAGLLDVLGTPQRICDTRVAPGVAANPCNGFGTHAGTLGPGGVLLLTVGGAGGVPASGAGAVVLNVTATGVSAAGDWLTVWPVGSSRPLASNLNVPAGGTVANRVIVKVGSAGTIDIYNFAGSADVIVDVSAYFTGSSDATATGARFTPMSPVRICDTRAPSSAGCPSGRLGSGVTIGVTAEGSGGLPGTGLKAIAANVTATGTTEWSYLTLWPAGASRPPTSDVNWSASGATVPNFDLVAPGSSGTGTGLVDVYNAFGGADVIVDCNGWYS